MVFFLEVIFVMDGEMVITVIIKVVICRPSITVYGRSTLYDREEHCLCAGYTVTVFVQVRKSRLSDPFFDCHCET